MLIRRMKSMSRCSPPGLSRCHCLTYDLLLFMPGLSADTLVWLPLRVLGNNLQSTDSESDLTQASSDWGFWVGKNTTENNAGIYWPLPREKPTI